MNLLARTALCLFVLGSYVGFAHVLPASSKTSSDSVDEHELRSYSVHPLYLKVRLNDAVKISKLHPADAMEGVLSQSVYSGDRELFPAGSHMRLIVSRLERRRRARDDHWPWVIQLFAPRYETYPAFQFGNVVLPGGVEVPLNVSVLSVGRSKEIQAGSESPRKDRTSGSR
jgi:hypothetical protein